MNNKPLLSICIPTYNRAQELKRCIESIINQEAFTIENVEIVISDNCSTDETETIVASYTKKYKNIHYYKNEKNVTMENFPIVLSKANGELAKLTNDTTVFENDSLEFILQLIRENLKEKPAIFFLNTGKKKDIYCKNLEEFLYNVSYNITWIAGFSLWEQDRVGIRNNLYACDKFLWQVPVFLKSVISHKKSYVINKKLFTTVVDSNKRVASYNSLLYTIFYKNYFDLLDEIFRIEEVSKNCYEWLHKDLLFNFFLNWLIAYELQEEKPKEEKSLTKLVLSEYKNKSYFLRFYIYFYLKLFYKFSRKLITRH